MAIYAQFDEAGPCLQVASNTGWSEFLDWVETLSGYTRIAELTNEASCEDIPGLREELEEVIEKEPPKNKDVFSVADGLIHSIDEGGKADIILITSGVRIDPKEEEPATTDAKPKKKPAKKHARF